MEAQNVNGSMQIDYLTEVLDRRGIRQPKGTGAAAAPAPAATPEPASTPEPAPTPTPAPPPPQPEPESGGSMLLIIGGAVALLVVIGVVVMVMKGKKKEAPAQASFQYGQSGQPQFQPHMPPPQIPNSQSVDPGVTRAKPAALDPQTAPMTKAKTGAAVTPGPGIKGISGHFAGQSVEFVNGQLTIGRDPRMAHLVYPQSFEEISRKHVTIRFDDKTRQFVLEDSSSNGTFLSSSEQLDSGKPYYLKPGDRFYLADPKEVFELTVTG
ncbi:FHA domain-containing protein [Anoxynatronum buryatiense]